MIAEKIEKFRTLIDGMAGRAHGKCRNIVHSKEDLIQEAYYTLVKCSNAYPDVDENDFAKLFSSSVRRRYADIFRNKSMKADRINVKIDFDEYSKSVGKSELSETFYSQGIVQIMDILSKEEKGWFKDYLNSSRGFTLSDYFKKKKIYKKIMDHWEGKVRYNNKEGEMKSDKEPRPTKAEVEFEGDCFSFYNDPVSEDCKKCLVSEQCKNEQTKNDSEHGEKEKDNSEEINQTQDNQQKEENEMPAVKEKKLKKEKFPRAKKVKEKKTPKANKKSDFLQEILKKDKYNNPIGFREGSASWIVYGAIVGIYEVGDTFNKQDLESKVSVLSKESGIKVNVTSRVPKIVGACKKIGILEKVSEGYKLCKPKK